VCKHVHTGVLYLQVLLSKHLLFPFSGFCSKCAMQLETCPMCRKQIELVENTNNLNAVAIASSATDTTSVETQSETLTAVDATTDTSTTSIHDVSNTAATSGSSGSGSTPDSHIHIRSQLKHMKSSSAAVRPSSSDCNLNSDDQTIT